MAVRTFRLSFAHIIFVGIIFVVVLDEVMSSAPQFIGKRQPSFVGKRQPSFVGKRTPQFIGKRGPQFIGKRAPQFIGKRGPQFVGKRKLEDTCIKHTECEYDQCCVPVNDSSDTSVCRPMGRFGDPCYMDIIMNIMGQATMCPCVPGLQCTPVYGDTTIGVCLK